MRRIFVTFSLAASCYGATILQPQKQPGSDDVSWTAQSGPHLMNLFGSMGNHVKRNVPVELQAATRFSELHPELAQLEGPNKLERRREPPTRPIHCEYGQGGKECTKYGEPGPGYNMPPPQSPDHPLLGKGRQVPGVTPKPPANGGSVWHAPAYKPTRYTRPGPKSGEGGKPNPPAYTEPRDKDDPRERPMRPRMERPRRGPPVAPSRPRPPRSGAGGTRPNKPAVGGLKPPSRSRPPRSAAGGSGQMTPAVGGMSMITYPGLHPPMSETPGLMMRHIVYGGLQPPGSPAVPPYKPPMNGERRVSPIPYGGYYMRPYGKGKPPASSN